MTPELNPEQAAAYLKKSASTLAQWRRKGVGPTHCRVGGTIRYSQHALDDYLRGQTRVPCPGGSRPLTLLEASA